MRRPAASETRRERVHALYRQQERESRYGRNVALLLRGGKRRQILHGVRHAPGGNVALPLRGGKHRQVLHGVRHAPGNKMVRAVGCSFRTVICRWAAATASRCRKTRTDRCVCTGNAGKTAGTPQSASRTASSSTAQRLISCAAWRWMRSRSASGDKNRFRRRTSRATNLLSVWC